ncbi:SOS response-associated peptidase [Novosphingobium olei]|uniref:SOS response-associated peptidase n=1 Tax=Novosphingobium olei TaxID=2728851 RepID=UPI0030CA9AA9
MCNLYRMTSNAQAIAALFGADVGGRNVPAFHEIYPGHEAPVLIGAEDTRLEMMQWGWPPFGQVKRPITNVRNLASPMWRAALADSVRRCLVPVTEFSEWSAEPDPATGRKMKHWFALRDQPLFAFAGVWRPTADGPRFAFLTCAANRIVGAVHPKAMPVILRPGEEARRWLSTDAQGAWAMQRSLADDLMHEVAIDDPPSAQGLLL